MNNRFLRAALKYQEMGFPILPCKNNKKPYVPWEQFQKSLPSRELIEQWWFKWSDANLAIVTGKVSGVMVVDVDTAEGLNALNEFLSNSLVAPTAITPSGGRHVYFKYRGGLQNGTEVITGCDFKTDGGYILAPPSYGDYRKNGRHIKGSYEWLPDLKITDVNPPPMPQMLYDALEQGSGTTRDKMNPRSTALLNGVSRGERNSTAARLVGKYINMGLSNDEIFSILQAWNQKNNPPLSEKEILKTIESIRKTDQKNQSKPEGGTKKTPSQTEILLNISEKTKLFHNSENIVFAILKIDGHDEIWSVRSREFKRWLSSSFYYQVGKAPNSEAINSTLNTLEGVGQFSRPERDVYIRVGNVAETIYFDLANDRWEVVEISKKGWRVIAEPPIYFRRSRGMLSIPRPEKGSIEILKDFLNLRDNERAFRMVVGWAIQALRPVGPYPILTIDGEQGSAKSSMAKLLRAIIDPNVAPLRSMPRSERDLAISGSNSWVIVLDNISGLSPWLSDALCRVSTGGGFSTRTLYSDGDETLFSATRPIILNGISDIVNRHDLADRSLFITLKPIPDSRRIPEKQLDAEFKKALPKIVGGLFTAVSMALKNISNVSLAELPRMADFALWVQAAEPSLPWPARGFMDAYNENRAEIVNKSLESNLLGNALLEWFIDKTDWDGTVTELLDLLDGAVPDKTRNAKGWPKTASLLSRQLRIISSFLRRSGIEIDFDAGRTATRKKVAIRRQNNVKNAVTALTAVIKENNQSVINDGNGGRCRHPLSTVITEQNNRPTGDGNSISNEGKVLNAATKEYQQLQLDFLNDGNDGKIHINTDGSGADNKFKKCPTCGAHDSGWCHADAKFKGISRKPIPCETAILSCEK